MNWHRCNPDPADASRVERALVAAYGDRDQDALTAVIAELGQCPNCLRQALFQAVGIATGLIRDHAPDLIMAMEMKIAANQSRIPPPSE